MQLKVSCLESKLCFERQLLARVVEDIGTIWVAQVYQATGLGTKEQDNQAYLHFLAKLFLEREIVLEEDVKEALSHYFSGFLDFETWQDKIDPVTNEITQKIRQLKV